MCTCACLRIYIRAYWDRYKQCSNVKETEFLPESLFFFRVILKIKGLYFPAEYWHVGSDHWGSVLLWAIQSAMYSSCRGTTGFRALIRVRWCCSLDSVLYSSVSNVFWLVDTQRLLNQVIRDGGIEVRREGFWGNSARLWQLLEWNCIFKKMEISGRPVVWVKVPIMQFLSFY